MVSFEYVMYGIGILLVVSMVASAYAYYRIASLKSQLFQLRESIIKIADADEKLYADMKVLLKSAEHLKGVAVSLQEISKLCSQPREVQDRYKT